MRAYNVRLADVIITPNAIYGAVCYQGDNVEMLQTGLVAPDSWRIWKADPVEAQIVTDEVLRTAEVWRLEAPSLRDDGALDMARIQTAVRNAWANNVPHETIMKTRGWQRVHPVKPLWRRLLARLWK
jgi:hypothetical protein